MENGDPNEQDQDEQDQDEQDQDEQDQEDQYQALNDQIAALDAADNRLTLELQDILTDVTSPENSDEEDEDQEIVSRSRLSNNIVVLFERMKSATVIPNEDAAYSSLYDVERYRQRTTRKLKKMKKVLRDSHFNLVVRDARFQAEVSRVRNLYTDLGGRVGLDLLVALYCYTSNLQDEGPVVG
jgi:cobalamin biosynthesis protein CobT